LEDLDEGLLHEVSKFARSCYAIEDADLLALEKLLEFDYKPIQTVGTNLFRETYSRATSDIKWIELEGKMRESKAELDDKLEDLTLLKVRDKNFARFDRGASESPSEPMSESTLEDTESDTTNAPAKPEYSPEKHADKYSESLKRIHETAFDESEDDQAEQTGPARKRQNTEDECVEISKGQFDIAVNKAQSSALGLEGTGGVVEEDTISSKESTEANEVMEEENIIGVASTVEEGVTVKQKTTVETVTTLKEEGATKLSAVNEPIMIEEQMISIQKETTIEGMAALPEVEE
jgi:hypothetical protein